MGCGANPSDQRHEASAASSPGLRKADNAALSFAPIGRAWRVESMAAVGRHCVNSAATQGWRCRQRLFGAGLSLGSCLRKRDDFRSLVGSVGKAKASGLGLEGSAGARDNKSAAETSETYPVRLGWGTLCALGGADSGPVGPGTLTRPV